MKKVNTPQKPTYIFHYTSELRINHILESGKLKVSNACLPKNERSALWLSTETVWDDSATKFHTKLEHDDAIGLGRIVLPFEQHFVTYAKWKHASNVHPLIAKNMEQLYPQYDRKKWWASFKDIPVSDFLAIEVWRNNKWRLYSEVAPRPFSCQILSFSL